MEKTNGNDPAFAAMASSANGTKERQPGLTKREYFAAMAMQGLYSNREIVNQWGCEDIVTENAVKIADALIEQLNK